ncbi:hypothetical protein ACT7T5_003550 [Vibrio cholerae]
MQIIEINQPNNESLTAYGYQQWSVLNSLEKEYENIDMSKISATSTFHDDNWVPHGGSLYNFRWNDWFPDETDLPLMLVCKLVCYHQLSFANLAISTVKKSVAGFVTTFRDLFRSKNILTSKRNQPFNTLLQLTSNDILLTAQNYLAKENALSPGPFEFLNRIKHIYSEVYSNAYFLTSGLILPWNTQNISVQAWVKKLRQTHGLNTSVKSYPPLDLAVVSQLVQNATPFIDEYYQLLTYVFNEIEITQKDTTQKKHTLTKKTRKHIRTKFGEQLSNIIPLKLDNQGALKASWFRELETLIQGAAAWIILLTTGLRNVDMRHLEKGCCQNSKRHDLLHYLITDIKKTHLSRYILPVPPQTHKAVMLLEQCKRLAPSKKSRYLFTCTSSMSNNNLIDATDGYKIDDCGTFNHILRNFASHYKIKLITLSDNNDEASCHCVRATLAGWIGTHSAAAVLLLKKLFGHSNALMPDAYLAHNPVIIKERNRHIAEGINKMSEELSDAIARGKVTGKAGDRLLVGAEVIRLQIAKDNSEDTDDTSKSNQKPITSSGSATATSIHHHQITEMDMRVQLKERIKELLLTRIKDQQIYALKTPMAVVCVRNTSNNCDAPCTIAGNHKTRQSLRLSKLITDALGTPPCPANCVGKACGDALFGDTWSRDLLLSFDYYIRYLEGVGHQSIAIRDEAKNFISTYGSILKELYADEREPGYFE